MAAREGPHADGPPAGEDAPAHRVLLVREWDSQMGGSGCCGRLGDGYEGLGRTDDYAHARVCMESMGEVYRALREACPDLDVTVVDTRNWAWLVPAVVKDGRRSGLSWPRVAREVVRATTPASVVLDGVVLASGQVPAPADAVDAVRARLAGAGGGPARRT
jgi:hypothetical protein